MSSFLKMLLSAPRLTLTVGMMLLGAACGAVGSGEEKQASNPWSSNHDSTASSAGSSRSSTTWSERSSSAESFDRVSEASELSRDEAYRRKILREMREEYEAANGPVDETELDY